MTTLQACLLVLMFPAIATAMWAFHKWQVWLKHLETRNLPLQVGQVWWQDDGELLTVVARLPDGSFMLRSSSGAEWREGVGQWETRQQYRFLYLMHQAV